MEPADVQPIPPQTDAHRCCFYLPRKKRYCTGVRLSDSEFCGAHRPTSVNSKGALRTRVSCPFDPAHTIWDDTLEAHKRVCPYLVLQRTIAALPCFRDKVNGGVSPVEEAGLANSLHCALADRPVRGSHEQAQVSPAASTPALVQDPREAEDDGGGEHAAGEATLGKLQRAVEAIHLPALRVCLQSLSAAAAGPWLLNTEDDGAAAGSVAVVHVRREHAAGSVAGEAAVPPSRHELQAAAIVQAIQRAGLLPPSGDRHDDDSAAVLVIEAGAGSAALSEELVCAALDSGAGMASAAAVDAATRSAAAVPDAAAATATSAASASPDASSAGPMLPLPYRLPPLRLLLLDRMGGIVRRDLAIMKALVRASGLPPWPGTAPSARLGLAGSAAAGTGSSADGDKHDDAATAAAAAQAALALAGYAARAALLRTCVSRVRIDLLDFDLTRHPAFTDATADAAPKGKPWQMCDPVAHQAALRPPGNLAKLAGAMSDAAGHTGKPDCADTAEAEGVSSSAAAAVDVAPAAKRARLSSPGSEDAACADDSRLASAGGAAAMPMPSSSPSPSAASVPRRALLVAKHVCGAATDFALRSYAAALVGYDEVARLAGDCDAAAAGADRFAAGGGAGAATTPQSSAAAADAAGVGLAGFGGVGLVTCCHHRCDWAPYVGKRFFRSAVAGDGRLAELLARVRAMGMTEAASAASAAPASAAAALSPSETSQAAVTAFVVLSLVSSWAGTFEKARAREKARAGGSSDDHAAPQAAGGAGEAAAAAPATFPSADKCEVGRACKLLIDAGRAVFLRRVLQRAAEISSPKLPAGSSGSAGAASGSDSEAAGDYGAGVSFAVGVQHFCPSSWTPENRMLLAAPMLPAHRHDEA